MVEPGREVLILATAVVVVGVPAGVAVVTTVIVVFVVVVFVPALLVIMGGATLLLMLPQTLLPLPFLPLRLLDAVDDTAGDEGHGHKEDDDGAHDRG